MELRKIEKILEHKNTLEKWNLVTIGDLFEFKNGLNKSKEFFGYGTPIVNYMDVFNNIGILKENVKGKVSLTESELRNYDARKGDVFFTRTSETPEEVGLSAVLLETIPKATFSGFILRARAKNNLINNDFKKYCFRTNAVRSQIISNCTYTTRALTNGTSLSKIKILLPPILEQQAIAKVLSDTDKLIQSLEKKIEKKKLMKLGITQFVFVSQVNWNSKKLGEIAHITMGQSPNSVFYNNSGIGLPLIQGNADIKNRKTIKRNYTSQITKSCKKGDLIMSVRAPVGEIAIATFDACIGRGVCSITYPNSYLYYYLIHLESDWSKHSTGSTFESVNSDTIRKLEIPIPPIEKQISIAETLSNLDEEIRLLTDKKYKYIGIKQSLLQQLLTGKIRLL